VELTQSLDARNGEIESIKGRMDHLTHVAQDKSARLEGMDVQMRQFASDSESLQRELSSRTQECTSLLKDIQDLNLEKEEGGLEVLKSEIRELKRSHKEELSLIGPNPNHNPNPNPNWRN